MIAVPTIGPPLNEPPPWWFEHPVDALRDVAIWTGYTWRDVLVYVGSWGVLLLFFAIARKLEAIRPIERHDTEEARAEVWMDYKLALGNYLACFIAIPIAARARDLIVAALGGGGWIRLESHSTAVAVLFTVTYLFFMDMYKYWLHRLGHTIPFLWSMHSFHHSAERITIVTGARHTWIQNFAYIPFTVATAMFVSISPEAMMFGQFFFHVPEMTTHLNYNVGWGRMTYVLNNPHWHRIHHSVQPEHIDKNFAATLPVMDFIFGTAVIPLPDEHPQTGLIPSDRPGLLDGLLWPWRAQIRAWMGTAVELPRPGRILAEPSERPTP